MAMSRRDNIPEDELQWHFRQMYVPHHMRESLLQYIKGHTPVGGFLQAVLENNLMEAVSQADDENLRNLPAFVAYLYNHADSLCWGSPKRVRAWLTEWRPTNEARKGS